MFYCCVYSYNTGVLTKYNLSVALLLTAGSDAERTLDKIAKHKQKNITNSTDQHHPYLSPYQKEIPLFHPKGCSGGNDERHKGDAVRRVKCKEAWLKSQGQWFLPDDAPTTEEGWFAANETFILQLQKLMLMNGVLHN